MYCMHCMTPLSAANLPCPVCGKAAITDIPAHHLLPGTLLRGRFYVGKALGEGGFGITYLGRDTTLDIKVAIKEYYPAGCVHRSNTVSPTVNSGVTEDRKTIFLHGKERFLQEARVLAKFSDERGIVSVRDFFEEYNTAYIVMEYLEGETLKQYIARKGKLSQGELLQFITPVLRALHKVHEKGLIHRDISPDNIMLVEGGVKLLDFGAARGITSAANRSLSVMLKPGYAPEEQYRSKGVQGPWTDIYALCATMYKALTGITPDDTMQRVYRDELQPVSALGIEIDPKLEQAMLQGLALLQEKRLQSVDALLQVIDGLDIPSVSTVSVGAATGRPQNVPVVSEISGATAPQSDAQCAPLQNAPATPESLLLGEKVAFAKQMTDEGSSVDVPIPSSVSFADSFPPGGSLGTRDARPCEAAPPVEPVSLRISMGKPRKSVSGFHAPGGFAPAPSLLPEACPRCGAPFKPGANFCGVCGCPRK